MRVQFRSNCSACISTIESPVGEGGLGAASMGDPLDHRAPGDLDVRGEDPFRLGLDGKSLGQRDQSEGPIRRQCRSVRWPFVTSNDHEFP